jgi:CHRD domain-containing protein
MKRLAFLPMLLLVFAAGCSEDSPAEPTPTTPTFSMALTSSQENPPITGAEASCAGNVTIRFNITRDSSQAITAANADFQANITGCPSTAVIRIAHIHRAPVGVNGDIVVNTTLAQGDVTLVSGAGSFTKNGIAMTPALTQEILDNTSAFYFNIHSQTNPGGVIRGQMVRTQ